MCPQVPGVVDDRDTLIEDGPPVLPQPSSSLSSGREGVALVRCYFGPNGLEVDMGFVKSSFYELQTRHLPMPVRTVHRGDALCTVQSYHSGHPHGPGYDDVLRLLRK